MDAPAFWYPDDPSRTPWLARLLSPIGVVYAAVGARRFAGRPEYAGTAPVICIGNLVAGGAGKTPTAIAIGRRLIDEGAGVHFLLRGYGGRAAGPLKVDVRRHTFRDVGDEALLLAAFAPTWVSRDRVAGAQAADAAGAEIIVMDDGFQNHPSLSRDLALIVVDSAQGFGNGHVIPSGPLREPVRTGLARAHGVILIGPQDAPVPPEVSASGLPVIRARMRVLTQGVSLVGQRVIAFAGIGRPQKFFDSLRSLGCIVRETITFPDHEPYSTRIVERMVDKSLVEGCLLVTTEKDMVRIPREFRSMVYQVNARLMIADDGALARLIADGLARRRGA